LGFVARTFPHRAEEVALAAARRLLRVADDAADAANAQPAELDAVTIEQVDARLGGHASRCGRLGYRESQPGTT
jgi:hypothetical protein